MTLRPSNTSRGGWKRLGSLGLLVVFVLWAAYGWVSRDQGEAANSLEPDMGPVTDGSPAQAEEAWQPVVQGSSEPERRQVETNAVVAEEPVATVDWQGAPVEVWTGQVLGSRSGQPVLRAEIEARFAQGSLFARTDDEGQFRFEAPPGQPCDLLVSAPGFAPRVRPRCVTGPPITILLIESAVLYGTYQPVRSSEPGALLQPPDRLVAQLFVPGAEAHAPPMAEQPLDEKGGFRFEDLEPGVYSVSVGPGIFAVAKDLALGPGDELEVRLATIEGRFRVPGRVVVGPEKEALVDAHVEVRYHALGVPGVLERDAREFSRSGPDGKIEFWAAEGMRTRLRITAPWGGLVETGFLDPSDWRRGIPWEWRMEAPARLAGRVVDGNDEGIAGVRVRLDRGGHERMSRNVPVFESHAWAEGHARELRTDAEGRFDFGEVPSKHRLVVVAEPVGLPEAEGSRDWAAARAFTVLQPGEEQDDLVLQLVGVGELRGTVVDAAGEPYPGVTVTVVDGLRSEMLQARSGADGTFWLGGFPAQPKGRISLNFEEGDRWLGSRRVRFPEQAEVADDPNGSLPRYVIEETFPFDRTLLARGWVLDDEGYGVPGARVVFIHLQDRSRGRLSVLTGERGGFELYRNWPAPGRVEVRVSKPGWTLQGTNKLVLDLPPADPLLLRMIPKSTDAPATVRGEVLLAGTQEAVPRLRVEGLRGVFTTQGSRFQITGITPGRYRPRIRTPGYEYVDLPRMDLSPGAVVDLGTVSVGRGSDLTVVVQGTGRRSLPNGSRLRLVYLGGPVERPDLEERRISLRAWGRNAKGPRWRAQGVARGRWKLVVTVPGYERFEKTVQLNRRRLTQEITLKRVAQPSQGR